MIGVSTKDSEITIVVLLMVFEMQTLKYFEGKIKKNTQIQASYT